MNNTPPNVLSPLLQTRPSRQLVAIGSVLAIIEGVLGVPIEGSVGLFLLGTGLYLFSLTALGILLATVAASMPQFGQW